MPRPPTRFSPARVLVTSFAGLIGAGTLLLTLPWASRTGTSLDLVDALFTATSAVCVTGLIVVDTPSAFSTFGQSLLLLLIQAGGLGYMTLSTVVAVALGQRLSLQERVTLREALNVESRAGLARFAVTVLKLTLAFELAGAALLALRWMFEVPPDRALFLGLFHAVSAFNNAGFALFSDNLASYRGDLVINLVVGGLIIAGGVGFPVLAELGRVREWRRLTAHSKLVIAVSALLLVAGTGVFFALERGNPRTLGPLSAGEAILASWFQAVSPRTAGFNTVEIGALGPPTLLLLLVLMFIGASPGSTGGGVKTSTFGLTVLALWATVRGAPEATAFGRRFAPELVARAFFICLITFLMLNVMAGLAMTIERRELLPTLFETTSAFGTVGLSTGAAGTSLSLSGAFSTAGKLLMVVVMFTGRVGTLTLAVALAGDRPKPRYQYPDGRVMIG
jgi:trk system potassium uptake protein TrkH